MLCLNCRVTDLENSLLEECSATDIYCICKGKPLPESLRPEVWQVLNFFNFYINLLTFYTIYLRNTDLESSKFILFHLLNKMQKAQWMTFRTITTNIFNNFVANIGDVMASLFFNV